jgi:hypothetical protein
LNWLKLSDTLESAVAQVAAQELQRNKIARRRGRTPFAETRAEYRR